MDAPLRIDAETCCVDDRQATTEDFVGDVRLRALSSACDGMTGETRLMLEVAKFRPMRLDTRASLSY
jgi:hypothetical protein